MISQQILDKVQSQVELFFRTPVQVRSRTISIAPDGTVQETFVTRQIMALVAARTRSASQKERDFQVANEMTVVVLTYKTEQINIGDEVNINNSWLQVTFIDPNRSVYLAFLATGKTGG